MDPTIELTERELLEDRIQAKSDIIQLGLVPTGSVYDGLALHLVFEMERRAGQSHEDAARVTDAVMHERIAALNGCDKLDTAWQAIEPCQLDAPIGRYDDAPEYDERGTSKFFKEEVK